MYFDFRICVSSFLSNFLVKNTVIEDELLAMKSGNLNKAYSYTSEAFRESTSRNSFIRFVAAYPALRSNLGFVNVSRNDISAIKQEVKGRLNGRHAKDLLVEFDLVKEQRNWKILSIDVSTIEHPLITQMQMSAVPIVLTKTYKNDINRYSMKYPDSWEMQSLGKGAILFNGHPGTRSYDSLVNIQTVLTKKTGGDFITVKSFIHDLKKQAEHQTSDVKFVSSGSTSVMNNDGSKLQGEYLVFTYTYDGHRYKQWQVVVLRQDKTRWFLIRGLIRRLINAMMTI